MKLWKIAGAVSGMVFLVAVAGLAVCWTGDEVQGDSPTGKDETLEVVTGGKPPPAGIQEELCERLGGFAEVLYQYDTDERKFYEGAEAYMTDKAFQILRPPDIARREEDRRVRVRSSLIRTDIYAYYDSEVSAEVIMESQFTLSQTANGSVTQYLKLSLEKIEGQWTITECYVIDTLEE